MMDALARRGPSGAKASRSWSSGSLLSFRGKILSVHKGVSLCADVEAASSTPVGGALSG